MMNISLCNDCLVTINLFILCYIILLYYIVLLYHYIIMYYVLCTLQNYLFKKKVKKRVSSIGVLLEKIVVLN